jgi:hypothetical protein
MLPIVSAGSELRDISGTYSSAGLSGLTSTEKPVGWGFLGTCKSDAFSLSMTMVREWGEARNDQSPDFAIDVRIALVSAK